MRAIILAAGRGSRLKELTDETPKCLMEVGGKSLLRRQVDAYKAHGIEEVLVVRGYLAEKIDFPDILTVDNPDWETTGLIPSLMCAERFMEGGFLFSYGDTTFDPGHVGRVLQALEAGHAMAGIIDTAWHLVYEGRDWHPPEQAENVLADASGRIHEIGKRVPGEGSLGEFIGLAGLGAEAASRLVAAYHHLEETLAPDEPWGQLGTLRMGYAADLLQHLINEGVHMQAVPVEGGYREVDTPEDLERAKDAVSW